MGIKNNYEESFYLKHNDMSTMYGFTTKNKAKTWAENRIKDLDRFLEKVEALSDDVFIADSNGNKKYVISFYLKYGDMRNRYSFTTKNKARNWAENRIKDLGRFLDRIDGFGDDAFNDLDDEDDVPVAKAV